MTTPLITIGISAYNARGTIEHAVRSALAQHWPNKQILIVDDVSTDGTREILESLAQRHEEITLLLHPKNSGVAAARNTLLKNATGEFVAFFDDDDVSDEHRIGLQYQAITDLEQTLGGEPLILCHTARTQIYPGGRMHYEPVPGMDRQKIPHGSAMALRILCGGPVKGGFGSMATCSQMARLSTYKVLGGFDENFRRSEDTDLAVRLALAGGYFLGLPQALVTQGMTYGDEKKLDEEFRYHRQLLHKHKDFITRNMPLPFILGWSAMRLKYLKGRHIDFGAALLKLALRHPLLTLKKIKWALPNRRFHKRQKEFHG